MWGTARSSNYDATGSKVGPKGIFVQNTEQNPLSMPDPRVRPLDDSPPVRPWVPGAKLETVETRILTMHRQRFENEMHPERSGDFTVIDTTDWVNCVAITPAGEAVMVEQYRFGSNSVTLETVAGMVEGGEDPMDTCRRELAEETGFAGRGPVVRLGAVDTNPAILTNRCHFGLIEGVERVTTPSLDQHEQIRPVLVKVDDVPGLIRDGVITHSLAVCAFHFCFEFVRGR